MTEKNWETISRFVAINSPWVTLVGEKLKDDQDRLLDYWRVEKDDSVIIITIQNNQLLFPAPVYRPGIKEVTLDFPGGRVPSTVTPAKAALTILQKELGINESDLAKLTVINEQGWAINSSFSNQKLYGFVAEILPTITIDSKYLGVSYPITKEGIASLLKELTCLQCRALLLEWLGKNRGYD